MQMQKAVLREAASQKHTLKRTIYSNSGLPSSKFAKPQDFDNNLFQRTRETDTSLFSQGIPLTIFPTFLLVSISHLISAGFLASNLKKVIRVGVPLPPLIHLHPGTPAPRWEAALPFCLLFHHSSLSLTQYLQTKPNNAVRKLSLTT